MRAGELIGVIQSDTLDKDITNKRLQVDQSLNNIKSLEDQLEKLKVLAPFDGVFSTDFADQKKNVLTSYPVGTTIGSNVRLGAVANLDTSVPPIKVDELDLPKIKVGQKAEVRVDAVSGKTFPAEVTQVSTVGTVTNGVSFYTVVLSLKNASELKYGMTATADIIIEDKRDEAAAAGGSGEPASGQTVRFAQKSGRYGGREPRGKNRFQQQHDGGDHRRTEGRRRRSKPLEHPEPDEPLMTGDRCDAPAVPAGCAEPRRRRSPGRRCAGRLPCWRRRRGQCGRQPLMTAVKREGDGR